MLALAVVVITAAVAGCAGDAQDSPSVPAEFVPPAWMAEQVQANDDLRAYQASCLTDAGFTFEVYPQGGYNFPEESRDAAKQKLRECTQEHLGEEGNQPPNQDQLRTLYQNALDTRDCLVAEGYDIGEPMSEEEYVDSGGQWSAYLDVNDSGMSNESWAQLKRTCPEPGAASVKGTP